MKNIPLSVSRRTFIHSAAPLIFIPRFFDPKEGGVSYNPNINHLRVAGIHDPKMTKEKKPIAPWKVQERLVDSKLINEHIDRLACAVAEENRPKDAWKKIFIKPLTKSWSDTIVAVKVNNFALQHVHSPVLSKVCSVLIKEVGVKASNIFVYDAGHGKDMLVKTKFKDIPKGVNIVATWGGASLDTKVAPQWLGGRSTTKCLDHFVKGKIDIIVNIAMCKGHGRLYGGFSMGMKNHLGTFSPSPAHPKPPLPRDQATEYIFAINKSPLILGKFDGKTKKINQPCQQLVIVDALWASKDGPMCSSSDQPDRLFMGTFSPAVDYLVANKFRKDLMEWPIHGPITQRFLTEFGVLPSNLPNGGKIINALSIGRAK